VNAADRRRVERLCAASGIELQSIYRGAGARTQKNRDDAALGALRDLHSASGGSFEYDLMDHADWQIFEEDLEALRSSGLLR
jgi:hypothetical protein